MKRIYVAAAALAIAVLCALVVTFRPPEPDATGSAPTNGDGAEANLLTSGSEAEPGAEEAAGPALRTTATEAAEGPDRRPGTGAWIVRGRVMLGFKDPAPGRTVTAKGYEGFEAAGTPVLEAELTSDEAGQFKWALPTPTRTLYLRFSVVDGLSQEDCLALPDAPPPDSITLYVYKRDARVVGRVTDMAGQPIDGAEIVRHEREPIACADDGSFEIPVYSEGGNARVNARAPGYALQRASASVSGPGSVARIEIKLPREFRITGTVTDPDGHPVEGAVVKTFMTSFHNQALTDARGEYVLGHLDPGRPRHGLYARHEEFTEARSQVTTEGDSVKADLQLGRGVRVAGTVTDDDGRPLEGASLYIGFSPSAYNRLDALARASGRFEFPQVDVGSQTMVASRPGYAPTRLVLDVKPEDESLGQLAVVLSRGRSVSGLVVDPEGRPVAGVHVSWTQSGAYVDGRIVTDADGRFTGHHLAASGLGAEVWGAAIQRLEQAVPDGTEAITDLELTVQPSAKLAGRVVDAGTGEPVEKFLIRLVAGQTQPGEPRGFAYSATWAREGHRFDHTDGYWDTTGEQLVAGAAYGVEVTAEGYARLTNRRVIAKVDPARDESLFKLVAGAAISGTLVDADSQAPVEGVVIKLYDKKNPLRAHGEDVYGRTIVRSDAKGHFRIGQLPEGEVRLYIAHPEYAPVYYGPVAIQAGTESSTGTIALSTGGRIEGIAADDDGQPLAGVRIQAIYSSRTWDTKTDAEGRFQFEKLPPGRFTVWRIRPGHSGSVALLVGVTYSIRIEVKDGATTTVRLAPGGSAAIRGRVVFDGEVPDGIPIHLEPQGEPRRPDRIATVVNGAFSFARVEPGAYAVRCRHYRTFGDNRMQAWNGTATVELAENETRDVDLTVTVK